MLRWRRLLVLSHRYLGIALSLLFVCWFASGFAIIYTGGMPRVTEAQRLHALPSLEISRVAVSPGAAQEIASTTTLPTLTTVLGRPAYRFDQSANVVFADDGERLSRDMVSSRRIISDYLQIDESLIRRIGTITEVDQWTIGLRNRLPLEKFEIADGRGSEAYVSQREARLILHTTSNDRFLAWIGAIPHWLYFLPLRKNGELWSSIVIWSSTIGTVLAVIGIILLFLQFNWSRLPNFRDAVPHRGIKRWHFITSLVFGLFVLTWVFSGLLSMDPYSWNTRAGHNLQLGATAQNTQIAGQFESLTSSQFNESLSEVLEGKPVKEVVMKQFKGTGFYQVTVTDSESSWGHERVFIDAAIPLQLHKGIEPATMQALVEESSTVDVLAAMQLENYDSYYYSRPSNSGPAFPLPVFRVEFADDLQTYYYFDLQTGEPVRRLHRWNRLERWLYNGFHSLDFNFWYRSRPFWDVGVWILLLGGLSVSLLGLVLAYRRIVPNRKAGDSLR